MSEEEISASDLAAWNEVAESHDRFLRARMAFYKSDIDRIALIRRAMRTPRDRPLAISLAQYLSPAEHMQLFEEWVYWSTDTDWSPEVHKFILSLPKEWVMERIEQTAEPYLLKGDETDFRRYLELYYNLDQGLAVKLARRAVDHPSEEIQEAGKDYLSALEEDEAHENE